MRFFGFFSTYTGVVFPQSEAASALRRRVVQAAEPRVLGLDERARRRVAGEVRNELN